MEIESADSPPSAFGACQAEVKKEGATCPLFASKG